MNRIEALTEILPYVREFQGKTFVIKLGGELCEGAPLENIAQQLSLIHHIGMKVVLVHGGGPQLDVLCDRLGIVSEKKAGRRITNDEALKAAVMSFCGEISTNLSAALGRHGVKALGLSGADASILRASKRPPLRISEDGGATELVDFMNVGVVERIDTELLQTFSKNGLVPVLSPIACDEQGKLFNINADTLASKLAQALSAEKLIMLSNIPGILTTMSDPSSLVSYADIEQIQDLIESGKITKGMLPKVQACLDALKSGVHRSHIIDGTRPGSLLMELFLNQGVGTMIVENRSSLT